MDAKDVAKLLLSVQAVTLRPEHPFIWVSGIISPIYCDNRLINSYPAERKQIVAAFVQKIKKQNLNPDVIAGVATGAISWGAWVAEVLNKPFVYIRGKTKEHGKQNRVEGKLEPGQTVVVIEDLFSTGGSSLSAVEAVQEAGGKVLACFAIFTYGFPQAVEGFKRANCHVETLSDFKTLLQVAQEQGIITSEQLLILKKFSADPHGWRP